ncbi:MAG: hypothetical protein ACTSUE_01340 [Promethearchaeota archaeon]
MTETSQKETKKVTTTILNDDYNFLKEHNMQVSAALSIGIQTLRKLFLKPDTDPKPLNETSLKSDLPMIKRILEENREILKRLGES